MGRCPNKDGISESGTKVVKRTVKKRMPPREKNADVLSCSLTNTDPMITDMIKKELEILNKAYFTGMEDGLTEFVQHVGLYHPSRFGNAEL